MVISYPIKQFVELMKIASHCAGGRTTGVLLEKVGGELSIVGTDGIHLAHGTLQTPGDFQEESFRGDFRVVLPKKVHEKLASLGTKRRWRISVDIYGGKIVFSYGNGKKVSFEDTGEERFPRTWRDVFPPLENAHGTIHANNEQLLALFDLDTTMVSYKIRGGNISKHIPQKTEYPWGEMVIVGEVSFRLDVAKIVDALANFPGGDYTLMSWEADRDTQRPIAIVGRCFRYLLMPGSPK